MKYLNCSRAWCCCWAAWNLLEQAEDGKIGLSRGMSPKLVVVGSWILFIIMKCLRVVKLVVIKRWSKGCYHHTISYEFWWRVLSRYPQLTWTNSLERELTYRNSLDLWASLSRGQLSNSKSRWEQQRLQTEPNLPLLATALLRPSVQCPPLPATCNTKRRRRKSPIQTLAMMLL